MPDNSKRFKVHEEIRIDEDNFTEMRDVTYRTKELALDHLDAWLEHQLQLAEDCDAKCDVLVDDMYDKIIDIHFNDTTVRASAYSDPVPVKKSINGNEFLDFRRPWG